MTKEKHVRKCECSDPGCPKHPQVSECAAADGKKSVMTLYRIDMEDRTGTDMCSECASDATDSGLFTDEPNFYSV